LRARRIEIAIERLVLDGFELADGQSIAAAISSALTDRFASHEGVPKPHRSIGPVEVGAPPTPSRIGRAVANAVTRGAP
jgi:hypothetical protein